MLMLFFGACSSSQGMSSPSVVIVPQTENQMPVFEIYPAEAVSPRGKIALEEEKPISPGPLPKVAIIIDDIGYDPVMVDRLLALDLALTFSILPRSPFQETTARQIHKKGREILLHLPMEPMEYPEIDPGHGALLTSMPPEKLTAQIQEHLDAVPLARGVNNHMGSRMTTMPAYVYQIFSTLKQRDMFFIDSLTHPESICRSPARVLQLPFAQRDIFLDHVQTTAVIRQQISRFIRIAHAYGEAIAIGHPHQVTYEALRQELPLLKKSVEIVPASQIVHTTG